MGLGLALGASKRESRPWIHVHRIRIGEEEEEEEEDCE
jgi:hypothetical protein